ncbi:MAG: BTAD domain-containing putative transcriptional regulator [Candidatus Xenobia bacterium]
MQVRDTVVSSVLLFSDDASGAAIFQTWLQQAGCQVSLALTWCDAVELATHQGVDLVVVDSRLAHTMDFTGKSGVRAIVLREATDAALPQSAGVDDVLLKPVAQGAFIRSIQSSLKQARLENRYAVSLSQQRREFVALVRTMVAMQEAATPRRSGHAERMGKLVRRVAEQLSLPYKRHEALELATLLHTLGQRPAVQDHDVALHDVMSILQHLDRPAEGPVETRILALVDAYEAIRPFCGPEGALSQLSSAGHETRLVKALEQVLAGTPGHPEAVSSTPQKRRVGLLQFLGLAALRNGELDAARAALQQALHLLHGTPVPGRVAVCEGLAMAALLSGDVEQAADFLTQAWTAADGQGDLVAGRLSCIEGLLAAAQGIGSLALQRARKIFEQAGSHLDVGRVMLLEALVAAGWPTVRCTEAQAAEALAWLTAHRGEHVVAFEPVLFGELLPAKAEQPPLPHVQGLRITTLGSVTIAWGDREVPQAAWKTRRSRSLFLYLACQEGRPVQDEKLMEMFWPEHDGDKARQNLHAAFTHIRKAFKGVVPDTANVVVCNKGAYRLNPELSIQVDALDFLRLVKAAKQAAAQWLREEAAELRQQAASLYRGAFVDGCDDGWVLVQRDELEMGYHSVVSALLTWAAEQRQHEAVLEYASHLLAVDPCAQEAHMLAMQSWVAQGRPDMAARQYQNCRHTMVTELHAAPAPEVTRLYQSLGIPA